MQKANVSNDKIEMDKLVRRRQYAEFVVHGAVPISIERKK
jgi:hypothetical protein